MAGKPIMAPSGALRPWRERRGGNTPSGRRIQFLLPLLAALALLLAPGRADADSGNTTFTLSATTSTGSTTVIVAGGGPLANQLAQALNGPNGALIANALAQVFGPGTVRQSFSTDTFTISHEIGPGTIPIGNGPGATFDAQGNRTGPINCNGTPNNQPRGTIAPGPWPAPNCDLTGYQQFFIRPGTDNFNTNINTEVDTTVRLGANGPGLAWLLGDLYTTFQTAVLDQDFNFIDTLLGRGRDAGPATLFSPMPMGFAPERRIATPEIDEALAYAKAPKFVKAPAAAPLGGGWSAWIRGDGGRARVGGDANNFGFGYRTASGEGGVEYATGA